MDAGEKDKPMKIPNTIRGVFGLAGLLAFALIGAGCSDAPGPATGDVRPGAAVTAAAMNHYIAVQETLAADSMEGVAAHAGELAAQLSSLDDAEAAAAAQAIADNGDIDAARRHFETVSIAVLDRLRTHGVEEGEYHEAHCRMAFGNRGASWVQADTTVNNPYYGATMLRCGEIRETFASTNGHAH